MLSLIEMSSFYYNSHFIIDFLVTSLENVVANKEWISSRMYFGQFINIFQRNLLTKRLEEEDSKIKVDMYIYFRSK